MVRDRAEPSRAIVARSSRISEVVIIDKNRIHLKERHHGTIDWKALPLFHQYSLHLCIKVRVQVPTVHLLFLSLYGDYLLLGSHRCQICNQTGKQQRLKREIKRELR
jgi:hypothetical protein